MAKEKNELLEQINGFASTVKRFALEQIKAGKDADAIMGTLKIASLLENNWKNKWYGNLLVQMEDKRFPGKAAGFYKEISSKERREVNFKALKSRCQKELDMKPDKWLRIFFRMINNYTKKISAFNHQAYKMLNEGNHMADVMDFFQIKDVEEEIEYEDRLWTLQALKRIKFRRKRGIAPTLNEFEIALKFEYADYEEIYDEQVACIVSTYREAKDAAVRDKIKALCYEYIEKIVRKHQKIDGRLVLFLLEGNWISKMTYQLFCNIEKTVKKRGMHVLVYNNIVGLRKHMNNEFATDTVRYLDILEKMYKP